MKVLTDFEKLILVFLISLLFMLLIIIVFHFFRIHRKDKLISNIDILLFDFYYKISK